MERKAHDLQFSVGGRVEELREATCMRVLGIQHMLFYVNRHYSWPFVEGFFWS